MRVLAPALAAAVGALAAGAGLAAAAAPTHRTVSPTTPLLTKDYTFLCSVAQPLMCIAIPSGGVVATSPLEVVVKDWSVNEDKGVDGPKMRWSLDFVNDTVTYSLNPSMCLQSVRSGAFQALEAAPCDPSRNAWALGGFLANAGLQSALVHNVTGAPRCATVMRCHGKTTAAKQHFCEPLPTNPEPATVPFVTGSTVWLWPCDAAWADAQTWTARQDCAPGCSPFMQVDVATCFAACDVAACLYQDYFCQTPNPTPPTPRPSATPSLGPSGAPSAQPSTSRPSAVPSPAPSRAPSPGPSALPSRAPSAAPSQGPATSAPSGAPSSRPTARPTVVPTARPSARLVLAAPSSSPSTAAAGWPWWWWLVLLLLLLLLCCCCVAAVAVARRRRRRKPATTKEETKEETAPPPPPAPADVETPPAPIRLSRPAHLMDAADASDVSGSEPVVSDPEGTTPGLGPRTVPTPTPSPATPATPAPAPGPARAPPPRRDFVAKHPAIVEIEGIVAGARSNPAAGTRGAPPPVTAAPPTSARARALALARAEAEEDARLRRHLHDVLHSAQARNAVTHAVAPDAESDYFRERRLARAARAAAPATEVTAPQPKPVSQMTVGELKAELRDRGEDLSLFLEKADLLRRIHELRRPRVGDGGGGGAEGAEGAGEWTQ